MLAQTHCHVDKNVWKPYVHGYPSFTTSLMSSSISLEIEQILEHLEKELKKHCEHYSKKNISTI